MEIKPEDFKTRTGRRVLTDDGQPGLGGVAGVGSTTERKQAAIAAAIYANCEELDVAQLLEVISWVAMYKASPDIDLAAAKKYIAELEQRLDSIAERRSTL